MEVWQTYREAILLGFDRKKVRRPDYSLRAYARDLGMAPSHLSDVLSKRRGLSVRLAAQVADALGLADESRQLFLDLVESEDARSANDRRLASVRLESQKTRFSTEVQVHEFEFLTTWLNPAILELITTHRGLIDPPKAARALKIPEALAARAFGTLQNLGLAATFAGLWARRREYMHVFSDDANEILRSFHRAILTLASERLDQVTPKERQNLSTVMSFDVARTEEARGFLLDVHNEFIKRFGVTTQANSVFVFNQNFFQADIGRL